MPSSLPVKSSQYQVLIVDDEPDIHAVTHLGLKGMRFRGRKLELLSAFSGKEAVDMMRSHPQIAVVLLDVVMESASAGLEACEAIREALGNQIVRILLRTGQPGAAPEKKTINDYDIDDYLPKTELTSNRLYTSVRTALKAWDELIELARHKAVLSTINDCVVSLHSFTPIEESLQRILATAVAICPTPLAVLRLETFEEQGNPHSCALHLSADPDAGKAATAIAQRIAQNPQARALLQPGPIAGGYLLPVSLLRELGYGWIYLDQVQPDELAASALPLLSAHAANALYSTVAQKVLADREKPIYDTMMI